MFHTALRYLFASLLVLSAACDTLGIESPAIHLSSELDVGRDLMKGCSSAVLEASALCAGRQPYRLYAEPSSACTSYFWCAPARGACLLSCAAGKVFDAACNCCRESTPSHAVDLATCSSSSSSSGTNTQRRRLLAAEASTAQPSTTQTLQAPTAATAAAGADLDDSTVIYYAATGVVTDSKGQQVPLPQHSRPGPPAFGAWSAYGKHYSTGPFAGSNVVKEPAVGSPRQVPTGSSSSKISNEIGSRPFSAAAAVSAKPPVYAEDDSSPQHLRSLLSQQEHQQHSTAQHAAARELSMKRLPPTSATDAAAVVAVAAVTIPAATTAAAAKPAATAAKPAAAAAKAAAAAAGSPPSAAKGLTPDDVDVPFLTVASVDAADRHRSQHHHHQAARLMHATGMSTTTTTPATAAATTTTSSSSSSSRGDSDIIDMGRLTGPEEDAAQEDFDKAGGSVKVNPTIVPLPLYMRGKEGPYHYEGYPSKHAAHRHRHRDSSQYGTDGYSSSSQQRYTKYKGRKATKGYRGSHSEGRHSSQRGPHSSHSQYDESAESLQQ